MIVCWRFIMNRSWIELDFSALRNNIRLYQQYLPQGCKIMGVIKSECLWSWSKNSCFSSRRNGD
jgi:hypothetical protein